MAKCSTLMFFNDSLGNPTGKIVDIDEMLEEMENSLNDFFRNAEFDADSSLISKTVALAKNLG
jgi:hypothetical protein